MIPPFGNAMWQQVRLSSGKILHLRADKGWTCGECCPTAGAPERMSTVEGSPHLYLNLACGHFEVRRY